MGGERREGRGGERREQKRRVGGREGRGKEGGKWKERGGKGEEGGKCPPNADSSIRPPLGEFPSKYCHYVWYEKLEWFGYLTVIKS